MEKMEKMLQKMERSIRNYVASGCSIITILILLTHCSFFNSALDLPWVKLDHKLAYRQQYVQTKETYVIFKDDTGTFYKGLASDTKDLYRKKDLKNIRIMDNQEKQLWSQRFDQRMSETGKY
jgi:hypothetical protein